MHLPRQGRGEAGKGRGPQVAQQRVGDAQSAARPAPDKEKGLPFGSPLLFLQRLRKASMPSTTHGTIWSNKPPLLR
ncbi:TPA: hypothetical protein ACKPX2_003701, partial [Stenotrophomonas maltophilia]